MWRTCGAACRSSPTCSCGASARNNPERKYMTRSVRAGVSILALVGIFAACASGTAAQQAGATVDAATRQQIIDGAIQHMDRAYIFEEVAQKMAAALRGHVKAG